MNHLYQPKKQPYTVIFNEIPIQITPKAIKSLRLTVYTANNQVRLSVPYQLSSEKILAFLDSKLVWLQKQRAKFKPTPPELLHNQLAYLGQYLELQLIQTNTSTKLELINHNIQNPDNGYFQLSIAATTTKSQQLTVINTWYRQKLSNILQALILKWQNILQVKINFMGIKRMKTRWGSCNVTAKRVWFNLELIKKPLPCLEYVVVHELLHLLEPTHNQKFKALLTLYWPNWKLHNSQLNSKHHP